MKPTTSQSILLHSMLSAAVAVIMAFGVSIAQFYFANGQDLILTGSFAVGSFAATFAAIRAAAWHAAITSPALPQSEKDTINQVQQLAMDAHTKIDSLAGSVLPFVHNHPAPQPPAQPVVSRAATTPATGPQQPIVFPRPVVTPATATIHFGDTNASMPVVTPPNA